MADVSRDVVIAHNGWEAPIYQRTFEVWATDGGFSARRTERLLQAMAELGDGEPVPSARTIAEWATRDAWFPRAAAEMMRSAPERVLKIQMRAFAMIEGALDAIEDCRAGLYNHDTKLHDSKLRAAMDMLKIGGVGTAGANAGGLFSLSTQELASAAGLLAEGESTAESEAQRAGRLRDGFSAQNRDAT